MQTNYNFFINNVLVPPPDNWAELEGDLSFENGSPEAVLNATKLIWKGKNAKLLNTAKNSGLIGGTGIFEGPSLRIETCNSQDVFFNGICDLTAPDTQWNCDIVNTTIRDKRIDTINALLDSISFAFLATTAANGGPTTGPYAGAWINAKPAGLGGDYLEVLYQNNNVPDAIEFFTMVLSMYNMVKEAIKIANDISGIITGIGAAATLVGLGGVALGVLELIGAVAGLILTCFALVDLFQMAIDYLISPVMTKLGMNANTMLTRACQYFGIQFSSSILQSAPYSNLCILPSKRAWLINQSTTRSVTFGFLSTYNTNQRMMYDEVYNFQHGGFAYGYFDGTIGDLLRALEEMFNAKAKVINNSSGQPVLYLERWDYFYDLANYSLPNISQQAPFGNPYKTNANEIAANYLVKYATDSSDFNTLNDYQGTSCYYTASPKVITNPLNVTLINLKEVNLQFAQATRKDQPTAVESIFNDVWNDLVAIPNAIINALNSIVATTNKIINIFGGTVKTIPKYPTNPFSISLGCLYLYNNVTDTPKALLLGARISIYNFIFSSGNPSGVTGYLIDPNNKGQQNVLAPNLSAYSLMKNFHYSSLVSSIYPPAQIWGGSYANAKAGQAYYNQWEVYDNNDIPLCCKDYNLIYQNNIIKDYNGNFGRVDSLKWNPFKGLAKITYRINNPYTYNIYTSYMIDGITSQTTL